MKIRVTNIPGALGPENARILAEELMKARDQIGSLYAGAVKTEIKATEPYPPIDMGTLMTGIAATPVSGKLKTSVAPSPVTNPYAVVMEMGRRPNQPGPPLDPILDWVQRKFGLSGKKADSAAFLVRRKIHRRGIKPRFFFQRARRSKQVRDQAVSLSRAAVRRARKRWAAAGGRPK